MENREQFARDNIGLIYSFLDYYHLRYKEDEILDILFIGYTYAINHFDEQQGTFATFAYACMYNEYCKYLRVSKYPKRDASNITFIPLDSTAIPGEGTLMEELIADPRVNVEADVLHNIYVDDTFKNVVDVARNGRYSRILGSKRVLTKKEVMVFNHLYVDDMTVAEVSAKTGLFKQSIHNIDRDIKRKLSAWFKTHENRTRLVEKEEISEDDPMGICDYMKQMLEEDDDNGTRGTNKMDRSDNR